MPETRHHAPNAPIILVATKADLSAGRHIKGVSTTGKEGRRLAKTIAAQGFFECSARTQDNLETVFDEAIRTAMKHGRAPSQCLLTTVCVRDRGLPDDCDQLMVQGRLRDDYVAGLPGGLEIIAEYYRDAPLIVAAIERDPHRPEVVDRVFDVVTRCVGLVRAGQEPEAFGHYVEFFEDLRRRYDIAR